MLTRARRGGRRGIPAGSSSIRLPTTPWPRIAHLDDGADGVVDGFARQARIERIERWAEVAREHYLFLAGPAQRPVRSEGLGVVGVDRVPAEPFFEVLGGGLLDEPADEGESGPHLQQEALDVVHETLLELPFRARLGGAEEVEQVRVLERLRGRSESDGGSVRGKLVTAAAPNCCAREFVQRCVAQRTVRHLPRSLARLTIACMSVTLEGGEGNRRLGK